MTRELVLKELIGPLLAERGVPLDGAHLSVVDLDKERLADARAEHQFWCGRSPRLAMGAHAEIEALTRDCEVPPNRAAIVSLEVQTERRERRLTGAETRTLGPAGPTVITRAKCVVWRE